MPSLKPFLKQKGLFSIDHSKIHIFFEAFNPHKRKTGPFSSKPKSASHFLDDLLITPRKTNMEHVRKWRFGVDDFPFQMLGDGWGRFQPLKHPGVSLTLRQVKADLDSGYGNLTSCTHPEDLDYNTEPWTPSARS